LDGTRLNGPVHAFVDDAANATDSVAFYWDDPAMLGEPFSIDPDAAFDFCGTDAETGLAITFNTAAVPNGAHQMTVRVTGTEGTVIVMTAKFDVTNEGPKEPLPVCGSRAAG
jgi:hypothetical protein